MSKSIYAISLILVRTLVATLSLLGVITCTKAAVAQQSYTVQGYVNSVVAKNHFHYVNDIAVDVHGNFFVLDTSNMKIHVSDPNGVWLYAIGLALEDRNAQSFFVDEGGSISVVSGSFSGEPYIGTVRSYSSTGQLLNSKTLDDSDGSLYRAVQLSDGNFAAWGIKNANIPTVWIFDASFNLIRSFTVDTLPGNSFGGIFAGLNGNIHYSVGNGIIVEITNTGSFVSSFSVSIAGIENLYPSDLVPLSVGRFLISDYYGHVIEVTNSGTVVRSIVTPSSNGGRVINCLMVSGKRLVLGQYREDERSVSVRDFDGVETLTFGRILNSFTNGIPWLKTVGWDDALYLHLLEQPFYSFAGLVKTDIQGVVESTFVPSNSDSITGNGFTIDYSYQPISVDGLGFVNFVYQMTTPVIIRLAASGGYYDSYEYPQLFQGHEEGEVRCDATGNRYLLTQYYLRKISPSGQLLWKVRTSGGESFVAVDRLGVSVTWQWGQNGREWITRGPDGVVMTISSAPDLYGNFVPDWNGDLLAKLDWLSNELLKFDHFGNLLGTISLDMPSNKRFDNFGVKRDGTIVASLLTESLDYPGSFSPSGVGILTPHWTETIPPTTAVTTNPSVPSSGWYTSPVTVQLSATDNAHGSRVKNLQVTLDSQSTVFDDPAAENASLSVTGDGNHSLTYFATDYAGNVESTKSLDIRIDGTPPVSSASVNAGLVTLSSTDAVSGVYKTYYSIGESANINEYTGPIAATMHKVYYWSVDNAGNVEVAKSIVLNPAIESIAVSAARLTGGFGVVGTVKLSTVAPAGGTTVTLTSSQPNIVGVEPTVFISAGQTAVEFDIDAIPVVADTTVIITASAYATSKSTLLTIHSPQPSALSLSPQVVAGGTSTTASISISGPAPVGGTVVSLASSSLSALVPTSVTIPAGQMTATFIVSTNLVANDTSAVISATVYGVKVKSTLSILGPKVTSVTVASASIASTATTTGTVTLSTNAPVGGKVVTLSSSNTGVATVPVSVTVPAGSNTANFTISAGTVAANTSVTITAATNGSTGTATLTVTPPAAALSTLTTNVPAATGGVAVTGTVTLTRAAPTGGAVVTLASSSTTLGTVPASVTVPAGATSVTFTITTKAVTTASTLTVTGTYLGVAKAASITVNPVRLVSTLTLNPTSVKGGTNSTGTVTLTGPATEAVVVTLTSGTTTVARVPASVTVPAGATTATFTITTLAQTATRTSIITARTGTTSRTATLSVTR